MHPVHYFHFCLIFYILFITFIAVQFHLSYPVHYFHFCLILIAPCSILSFLFIFYILFILTCIPVSFLSLLFYLFHPVHDNFYSCFIRYFSIFDIQGLSFHPFSYFSPFTSTFSIKVLLLMGFEWQHENRLLSYHNYNLNVFFHI